MFRRTVKREIKGFNEVLNSFKILELEFKILVRWLYYYFVMPAYVRAAYENIFIIIIEMHFEYFVRCIPYFSNDSRRISISFIVGRNFKGRRVVALRNCIWVVLQTNNKNMITLSILIYRLAKKYLKRKLNVDKS